MSKIKIKNFGPIKEGYLENNGWLDVKKVTVFIGNQGSGKSAVAKLISTFSWIEKVLTRGDFKPSKFTKYSRFRKNYCAYHRIDKYFFDNTDKDVSFIEYVGDFYTMKYKSGKLSISKNKTGEYSLPQIMYVPAERNFISNVKAPRALKLTSDSLIEFVTEFDNAKNEIKGSVSLPINNVDVEYNKLNDIVNVKGKDYKVRLTEASSGFQSLVPLFLVSWYLANSVKKQSDRTKEPMSSEELSRFKKGVDAIWSDESLNDEQRRAALSVLSSKFNKTALINIVEEPEQNLFPTSQRKMLNSLLSFNNMNKGNKLIMTTHSPYLINYLSIAIQGASLLKLIKKSDKVSDLMEKFEQILPEKSAIGSNDVVVYQMDETNGTINKLPTPYGIPSDKNYLNQSIKHGNTLFDKLLEIEEEL